MSIKQALDLADAAAKSIVVTSVDNALSKLCELAGAYRRQKIIIDKLKAHYAAMEKARDAWRHELLDSELEATEKEITKDDVLSFFISHDDDAPQRIYGLYCDLEDEHFKYVKHSGMYCYNEERFLRKLTEFLNVVEKTF